MFPALFATSRSTTGTAAIQAASSFAGGLATFFPALPGVHDRCASGESPAHQNRVCSAGTSASGSTSSGELLATLLTSLDTA